MCATSSTTPGKPVRSICPTAPEGLNFIDIGPDAIAKTTQELGIDAWFLALHDKAAKPYVDALAQGVNPPILIDLRYAPLDHQSPFSMAYFPHLGLRDEFWY